MIKQIIILFTLSTIFCFSQDIVDYRYISKNQSQFFPLKLIVDENNFHVFNWLIPFDDEFNNHFYYFNMTDDLEFNEVINSDYYNITIYDIIYKNNKFLFTHGSYNAGTSFLLEFDKKDINELYNYGINKYKAILFFDDKLMIQEHERFVANKDSLVLRLFLSDYNETILDTIEISGFEKVYGDNIIIQSTLSYTDEIKNDKYFVIYQSYGGYFTRAFILKIDEQFNVQMFKEIKKSKEVSFGSYVPYGQKLFKNHKGEWCLLGYERDTQYSIIYGFVKTFDENFKEISHKRIEIGKICYLVDIYLNDDLTYTSYGQTEEMYERVGGRKNKFLYAKLDSNFNLISYEKWGKDSNDNGINLVSRKNGFDYIFGYENNDIYIAKINNIFSGIEQKNTGINFSYDSKQNSLEFDEIIPNQIEIINLLGQIIYKLKVQSKIVNLPILPDNQIVFIKIGSNKGQYIHRLK